MFTIHHQPQLALWLREREKPQRLKAIMEKERKSEFLRNAEEKGYLQSPTKDYLLERGRGKASKKEKSAKRAPSVSDIHLVKLCSVHLMNLGQIQLLTRLKICILPGNYITGFVALANCAELVKLDLHSNQISTLPGPEFWRCLPNLKILHLHNNCIGKLDSLQHMGQAGGIQVLTMYDTPISLKKTYRHHVVNSIWSIKALDFHVISDEEIIEDASFGGHFASMNPSFHYNPVPHSKKDSTFEDEMSLVQQVLEEVSSIQAHHSPVLIIQKVIKGFLVRRRQKLLLDTKIWASVCIQRFWRHFKGLEWKPPAKPATPTHTPAKPQAQPAAAPTLTKADSPLPPVAQSITDASTVTRIDYDTYLANRRPGSKTPSIVSSATADRKAANLEEIRMTGYSEDKDTGFSMPAMSSATPGISEPMSSMRKRTNLHIDLTKLQTDTMFQSDEARQAIVFETSIEEGISSFLGLSKPREQGLEPVKSSKKLQKDRRPKEKKKEFKTVKQMLGPLPNSQLEREREDDIDSDEEEPPVKFRLSGLKSVMHDVDLLQEMLIARREAGEDIRNSHKDVIDRALHESRQKPIKSKSVNADQRLFARVQGTMGMSCLRAVQQAYRDRAKAEKLVSTVDKVVSLREMKESSKQRARNFLEEKRLQALKKKDMDANSIAESLERRANLEKVEKAQRKERRSKSHEMSKSFSQDKSFAVDFTGQHTSISNALLRHDRQAKDDMALQGNRDTVEGERDHNKRQLELVQKYLEHRQMMRQAQVAVERAALDTRMLQEANERLMEARTRVTQQKQKSKSVQAFYPLPRTATDPVLPPVNQEGKPDRFHTLIAMYEGRVGNHPTVVRT
ncbi:uncharacterized protein LOC119734216 [Patiria miniata]|uniref:Leucine-rich repeat and IQ domain-containing protein 3 n=1 Tax=Patiria miniata TaxID=46514 RepID=A0A914AIN2_PATMI|nr:uncharacterized protein LOC119734216 [Patiria miniata]